MKSVTDELPRVKNRKKIDVKEFAKLAKKVRDIFEEEEKKAREQGGDGHRSTTRFSIYR